jgi:hypothetical protein
VSTHAEYTKWRIVCQGKAEPPLVLLKSQDFIDIFTTLMISLPLKSHRVRFKTYPFTFTTEEALQNMASLRLTQTNRMDDPKVYKSLLLYDAEF